MSNSDTISAVSETPVAVWAQADANSAKVSLNGVVNVYSLGGVWTEIRESQDTWLAQGDTKSKTLTVDCASVNSLDGAGIAFLISIEEAQSVAGGKFELSGLDPRYQPLLKEFDPIQNLFPAPSVKPKRSFIVSTGMAVQNLLDDLVGLVSFIGHFFSI